MRPAYEMRSVTRLPRGTASGRFTSRLFWPRTRMAMTRPWASETTPRTASASWSRRVRVESANARTCSVTRARASIHSRAGWKLASMS